MKAIHTDKKEGKEDNNNVDTSTQQVSNDSSSGSSSNGAGGVVEKYEMIHLDPPILKITVWFNRKWRDTAIKRRDGKLYLECFKNRLTSTK